MAATGLVISAAATDDLKNIYQHTVEVRGKAQADKYWSGIKKQLWLLAQQPQMGRQRPELSPDIRSLIINRHVIFYRVNAMQVEIIRLLNGRQDVDNHLMNGRVLRPSGGCDDGR